MKTIDFTRRTSGGKAKLKPAAGKPLRVLVFQNPDHFQPSFFTGSGLPAAGFNFHHPGHDSEKNKNAFRISFFENAAFESAFARLKKDLEAENLRKP